jgi:hypothetical protein
MVRDGGMVWSSAGSQHVNRQPGKMLLKIYHQNIEIDRMNTYIIFNQNSIINAMPHVLRASSAV